MQVPQFGAPFEKVETFTKAGEETQIIISVQSTNFRSLAEIKGFGYIDQQSILKESNECQRQLLNCLPSVRGDSTWAELPLNLYTY